MQNHIHSNNLSTIKMKNLKSSYLDHTQNKSTNTIINLISSNKRFNNGTSEFNTINPKKNIDSYFFIKPKQKIFYFRNDLSTNSKKQIKLRNSEYFLPLLSKNHKSVKNIEKSRNLLDPLRQTKIKIKKKTELIINPVSLYLCTLSNENRTKKMNSYNKKSYKIKDEFLERIKDYRKKLKEQMIKRSKFQYSHSNNSLNNSLNKKFEKEPDKEKEITQQRFNYNQNNDYIFSMNKNVDKALNIFYQKLKNSKVHLYDKERINYNSEKSTKLFK